MTKLNPQLIPAIFEDAENETSSLRMMEAISAGSVTLTILMRLQKLYDTGNLNPEGIEKLTKSIDIPRFGNVIARAKGIQNGHEIFVNSTVKKVSAIFFGNERPELSMVSSYAYILTRKLGVNMFSSLLNSTLHGQTNVPITIMQGYFLEEFQNLLEQFESLKKSNKTFIRIPEGEHGFNRDVIFINSFIESSITELRILLAGIDGYLRRPLALYSLLKRIKRERAYIESDRAELRENIAKYVKASRGKTGSIGKIQIEPLSRSVVAKDDLDDKLSQVGVRLKNIRKKLSAGMVSRILSRVSIYKLYDEVEEIFEKLTLIEMQQPENSEKVSMLKADIMNIRGFQSSLLEEKTTQKVGAILKTPEKTKNAIIELDEYAHNGIAYLEKLLLDTRRISSTRDNDHEGKNSKGDGTFRQDVISPLLRSLITNIKKGHIDASRFSWFQVIELSKNMHIKNANWRATQPIFMRLDQMGDIKENMFRLMESFQGFSEVTNLPLSLLKSGLEEYMKNNSVTRK